jgi:hypothetical protein
MERFLPGAILSKKSQVTIAKWSQSMLVPDRVQIIKNNLSHNRIEKLVLIILGRFSFNKTQK